MPTVADLEARAIWKLEQAGYGVTTHPGHGSIVTNPSGHTIATLTSLDELRALADQFYELVWLGIEIKHDDPPNLRRRLIYSISWSATC